MTKHATCPPHQPDPLTAIMLALLTLAVGLVVLVWLNRVETGELVLTETGCQALTANGVEPEALPETSLCRLHARFEFARRLDRFGTIRIESPHGPAKIELQGRYIASVTTQ